MQDKILIIALGNDLLGDDGLGIVASAILRERLHDIIEIEDVFGGGLELLDLIEGKDKVLILDSIQTGTNEIGTIMEIDPEKLSAFQAYSPHYIGLPDVLRLGKELNVKLPEIIKILCMEIPFSEEIKQGLSLKIKEKLPEFCKMAEQIIRQWGLDYYIRLERF
ncbi:MAG: hydrogenase maturation protease [Candidatus Kapabacteria bacterium]|nr:hydrogenase maturation protease [Candidatus Kapabacteria bacterium]